MSLRVICGNTDAVPVFYFQEEDLMFRTISAIGMLR
jgi:hypothetical protein